MRAYYGAAQNALSAEKQSAALRHQAGRLKTFSDGLLFIFI